MSIIMSRDLYECLERSGLEVRDDYSGRFMFGERCFGYVDDDLARSVFNLSEALRNIGYDFEDEALGEEAEEILNSTEFSNSKTDNMGLSYIVYFPGIQVGASADKGATDIVEE